MQKHCDLVFEFTLFPTDPRNLIDCPASFHAKRTHFFVIGFLLVGDQLLGHKQKESDTSSRIEGKNQGKARTVVCDFGNPYSSVSPAIRLFKPEANRAMFKTSLRMEPQATKEINLDSKNDNLSDAPLLMSIGNSMSYMVIGQSSFAQLPSSWWFGAQWCG